MENLVLISFRPLHLMINSIWFWVFKDIAVFDILFSICPIFPLFPPFYSSSIFGLTSMYAFSGFVFTSIWPCIFVLFCFISFYAINVSFKPHNTLGIENGQ